MPRRRAAPCDGCTWAHRRMLACARGIRGRPAKRVGKGRRMTAAHLTAAGVATNGPPMLRVDDLHVFFNVRRGPLLRRKTLTLKAVDGVSFDVNEGETFSIVGESGCGKTTTARAILKVEAPSSGSILWQGRSLEDID